MKKRQKFTVTERSNITKCINTLHHDSTHTFIPLTVKKKISSNPLVQKNLKFLHNYNNLFGKSWRIQQGHGDSNTNFKKSLRNYGSFDLIRDLYLDHKVESDPENGQSTKSQTSRLEDHHVCCQSKIPKPVNKFTLKPAEVSIKEIYTAKESDKSDAETEFCYSPTESVYRYLGEGDTNNFSTADVVEQNTDDLFEDTFAYKKFLEVQVLDVEFVPENEEFGTKSEDSSVVSEKLEEIMADAGEEPAPENVDEGEAPAEPEIEGGATGGEVTDTTGPELTEDEEGDEMAEVEKIIQQASEELEQVAEANKQLMDEMAVDGTEIPIPAVDVEAPDPGAPLDAGGDGSVFKFDPKIDAAIIRELDEAEKQARCTAIIILKLKDRVAELLKTEKMTEVEAKELEEKNNVLKEQLILFETKTKRIQALIAQSNLFESMLPIQPPLQMKHNEDILPKVLICGYTENNMPKIIVCDDKKNKRCSSPKGGKADDKRDSTPKSSCPRPQDCSNLKGNGKRNLEELPQAPAAFQESFFPPQQLQFFPQQQPQLFPQQQQSQAVQYFQNQLWGPQNNMDMMNSQNGGQNCPNPSCPKNSRSSSPSRKKGGGCGPGAGLCPAEIVNRLKEYSDTTQNLEKQLGDMEKEVKEVQQEIIAVQKEREHLEHHRKQLCGRPPCFPFPPPCGIPPCLRPPCMPPPCPPKPGVEQQLNELREQYNRLQDDFKAKLTEVASLRAENEKFKEAIEAAKEAQAKAEEKLRECEKKLKVLLGDKNTPKGEISKERVIELEQQVKVFKEMHRQAQDELEELRACVEDLQGQVNDYRNKYLEAEQTVEEHRRQIELMKLENNRISEQVNLEIQKVKNQFQEKLQELAPLPDILKATQVKLQEAQQMHLLAERNNEALAKELQTYKDKIAALTNDLQGSRSTLELGENERLTMTKKIEELEAQVARLIEETQDLNSEMLQLKEQADMNEMIANGRAHEITQLNTQLESVREDCARQVAKTKDRCNIVRRSMQNQISDLERQLAQTKACAKAAEKDRDEVRQKMQAQITNLNSNFEDALMRIKNLQGHVNFMKNTYGPIFPCKEIVDSAPDPCSCGVQF